MANKKPALGRVEFKGMDALIPPKAQDKQEVQEAQQAQKALETQEQQEVQEVQEVTRVSQQTQGKKGQKLPRINMAFTKDNLAYLHRISRIEGCSITDYVNHLIDEDSSKKTDLLKQVDAIKNNYEKKRV